MRQYNYLWHLLSINFLIAGLMEYRYHPSGVVLSQTPAIFILKCDNTMPKSIPLTIDQLIAKKPSNSKLTPIVSDKSFIHKGTRRSVLCRCECGKEKYIDIAAYTSGHTLSCKCYHVKMMKTSETKFKPKYKGNIRVLYDKWKNMISRCYDPLNIGYCDYGAKGVTVCDEWRNDYQCFLDWALENGWKPGLHIDKDIKGNGFLYSPSTCIFVTPQENYAARKHIHKIIYNGVERIAAHVAKESGVSSSRYFKRLREGWSVYDAATQTENL